jgi:PAS domain S-box-containing protein
MLEILDPVSYRLPEGGYFFWSCVINALAAAVSGAVVLHRDKGNWKNISFALVTLCEVFWCSAYAFSLAAVSHEASLFWTRMIIIGVMPFSAATLFYVLKLTESRSSAHRRFLQVLTAVNCSYILVSFSPLLVKDTVPKMMFIFWGEPGPLFYAFQVSWFVCISYAFWVLATAIRRSSGEARKQMKAVMAGLVIATVSGAANYALWFDIPFPPYLNITLSFWVVFTAYAMLRYGLFPLTVTVAAPTVIETMADPLFAVGGDGRVAFANRAAADAVGLSPDALHGQPVGRFLPAATEVTTEMDTAGESRRTGLTGDRFVLTGGDGRVRPISLSAGAVPGTGGAYVLVCHDVSDLLNRERDLKRQQEELSSSHERLKSAVDGLRSEKALSDRLRTRLEAVLRGIGEAVVVVDATGRLAMVNPAAAAMVGIAERSAVGSLCSDVFPFRSDDGTAARSFVRDALESGQVVQSPQDTVLALRGLPPRPVSAIASPLVEGDDISGAVIVISERRPAVGETPPSVIK